MKYHLIAFIMFACNFGNAQTAEELQAGVMYTAGQLIKISQLGVEFAVPPGWQGGLPQGSDAFIMDCLDGSASAFITADQSNEQQIRQVMSTYVPLDGSSGLTPSGQVSETENILTCDYLCNGTYAGAKGKIFAKVGGHGYSTAVILLANENVFENKSSELLAFVQSINLGAPKSQPAGQTGNGDWDQYMRGRYVKYLKTENGYSEENNLWLCSDGSFAMSGNDSYLSSGGYSDFSYAGQQETLGKWSIAGNTLTLSGNDGNQWTYSLELYDDKLYLNDRQWFRLDNERCK